MEKKFSTWYSQRITSRRNDAARQTVVPLATPSIAAHGNYLVSSNLGSSVLMLSSGTIGYVENQIADIVGGIHRCSLLVGNEAITHNRLRKGAHAGLWVQESAATKRRL